MNIDRVKREVIERKLLVAIEDENTAAVLTTKEDLDLLIFALDNSVDARTIHHDWGQRRLTLRDGLKELRAAAFAE